MTDKQSDQKLILPQPCNTRVFRKEGIFIDPDSDRNSRKSPFIQKVVRLEFISSFLFMFSIAYYEVFPISAECALFFFVSLYFHSFILLKRKKTLENFAFSKVRGLAMGSVKLRGKARQKFALKSPYGQIDCVYYEYYVTEENGENETLVEWGDSRTVPFYLEDSTGRVLVNPEKAEVEGLRFFRFDDKGEILSIKIGSSLWKVTECLLLDGNHVQVMGYADSAPDDTRQKLNVLKYTLRALGRNKAIKEKIGREIADKRSVDLDNSQRDRIVIGAHPFEGLNLISGNREYKMIKELSLMAPALFIFSGAGIFVCSSFIWELSPALNDFIIETLFRLGKIFL